MLIGIISDTHDHVAHVEEAIEIFKDRNVNSVVHAGDHCSPFTIPPFEGLTLHGIFGNNDGDHFNLIKQFRDINATLYGEFTELDFDGKQFAVYHGTYQPITEALRNCGAYDVVISGHTHEVVHQKAGDTLAINPGTAHGFGEKATIAFLDTDTMKPEFVEL